MNTRYFIHTEQIISGGQLQNFVIHFPPRTAKITSLFVSAEPFAKEYDLRHVEVGLLRLSNIAGVLYECQVRFTGQLAWFPKVPPFSYLEQIRLMPVSGAKLTGQTLNITVNEPYLFARFEAAPLLTGYTLKLTFTYLENEN